MFFFPSNTDRGGVSCRQRAAYTLVEMMVAGAIFSMVITAMMYANYVGLRSYQMVESKAGMSDASRTILNQLPGNIREAKLWYIGTNVGTTFTALANGVSHTGPALKLVSNPNATNIFTVYYYDASEAYNGKLLRYTSSNGTTTASVVLASNLINNLPNTLVFQAEDYKGNVSAFDGDSRAYRNVIHTTLSFCKFQYPMTAVGTNSLYDLYILNFKATPHLPE
jgi:Tfp pilus assembly protein PilW